MSSFSNKSQSPNSRAIVIKGLIIFVTLIIVARIFYLQIGTSEYKTLAFDNAIFKKTIYPDRGIIFDVNNKPLLENITTFDLIVTPSLMRELDTAYLCDILKIPITEFRDRIRNIIVQNGYYKASVFETILPDDMIAKLEENLYKFEGIDLQERTIRSYPYRVGAALLGYDGEVDSAILRKRSNYQLGDYIGLTGLENFYESTLRGQKGYQYFMRNNRNRVIGAYQGGNLDKAPVGGKNIRTHISLEIQAMSEELLKNKIGSIVAIDPSTGGVIAMASSPIYNPNLLTGKQRNKNFIKLSRERTSPLLNRCIKGLYSPGSAFKPIDALIGLQEGVIHPSFSLSCAGAYTYCGKNFRCTHSGAGHAANLDLALLNSCNSYFIHLFRMIIDNNKYANVKIGLMKWKEYLNSFGLGKKTNIDIAYENAGYIPDSTRYNRIFGTKWNSCNIASLGIGQGELQMTPLQLANMVCIIANRGYYYTPHFVRDIEHADEREKKLLARYKQRNDVLHIPNEYYESVIDAMYKSVEFGTSRRGHVAGVAVCAKTGTVENKRVIGGKVVKMPNHSILVAFAPRENPTIAIAVVIENSGGYGGTWAAPISSLIIEKYLKGHIAEERKAEYNEIRNANLIPQYLLQGMPTLMDKKTKNAADTSHE